MSGTAARARSARWAPVLRAGAGILCSLAIAAAITVGLEFVHSLNDPWLPPLERLRALETDVVALGGLLVWALVVFLQALTNRLWLAAGIVTALAALIAFADYNKMHFRGEPLFATDVAYLSQFGFLVHTVGTGPTALFAAALLAIPVAFWAVARFGPTAAAARRRRADRVRTAASLRRGALLRVVAGTSAAVVIFSAATFNQPGNAARELYEATRIRWAPWNQAQNYADNGFIAGLLYNLPASAMDQPAGYSANAMADLVARYSAVAADLNATRDPAALADTNIVLVLSESLSDPLALDGVAPAEDPLPFLRELMARNRSGTLLSSGYGGGTANVEFEVLTGMAVANLQSQVHSPFQMLVAQSDSFPSHLASFGEPDRATLSIHPYLGTFYRRNAVYPALGFERSIFIDEMTHATKVPGDRYVSDAALFTELLDQLRASDRPVLANVVTMQNHGPQEGFPDPIPVDGPLTAQERATAGQYLRGLKYSDDALRQLVDAVAGLEERTIVLVYGDHLPTVWPESVLRANGELRRYETPWVVFANFPTAAQQGGVIGANQLVNQVLDAAGAPHTPWTALIHELAAELPVMETSLWLDPAGAPTSADQLSARARELLADYRVAQYDMVVGEGWATAALLARPH